MPTNQKILEKADLALSDLTNDGGLLAPADAKKFILHAIDKSVVMKLVMTFGMKSHTQRLPGLYFNSRILRAGTSGQALPLAQRSKPDTTNNELVAVLVKAQVDLDDEVLEDNIEQGTLKSTVMSRMTERIGLDMDELTVNGDTASTDEFLALYDGMLKSTTSHIVLGGNAPLTDTILRSMLKAIPSPALRDKTAACFLTSTDAEIDYRHALSQRGDSLGVSVHGSSQPVNYSGVKVLDVPVFPETLGGSNDETNVLLCHPKNWAHGIWRRIKMETERDAKAGVTSIIATMRMKGAWNLEDYTAKATGVKVA